jgi:hypothetical protein
MMPRGLPPRFADGLRRRPLLICVALGCSFLAVATATQADVHSCSADAIAKAEQLLRFHAGAEAGQPIDVEQKVKALPSIKALKGDGRFDVLEVFGHIYKANYRMRLIYARITGRCLLMGQEILEASDPY